MERSENGYGKPTRKTSKRDVLDGVDVMSVRQGEANRRVLRLTRIRSMQQEIMAVREHAGTHVEENHKGLCVSHA